MLEIHDLHTRHPGVSLGVSLSYSEAAEVCLDRHHSSPTTFQLERNASLSVSVQWFQPLPRLKKSWANDIDATEAGAYCLALAAIEKTDGLVAVSRAEKLTGADYYLGEPGEPFDDLEASKRLEVSGVDLGGLAVLQQRLRVKVKQAQAGKSSLPALAAVVGFAERRVLVMDV